MEIIRRLFGRGGAKKKLIRALVRKRARTDPLARRLGNVDSLPDYVLMGLPEATVVDVVERYWRMKSRDPYVFDEKILEGIEAQRAKLRDPGSLPSPLTLSCYIKYRLSLEHSHGASLLPDFVDEAIEEANKVFGPGVK